MQKIGTGYTMYFNKHENRTGSLFQGKFKSKYVDSDEYLKYLSVYVSRNNEIHNITNKSKFRSSFKLHITNTKDQVCDPSFILSLFDAGEYIKFSNQALKNIREQKDLHREIEFRSQ